MGKAGNSEAQLRPAEREAWMGEAGNANAKRCPVEREAWMGETGNSKAKLCPVERFSRMKSWLKPVNRQSEALTRLKAQRLWRKRECPH